MRSKSFAGPYGFRGDLSGRVFGHARNRSLRRDTALCLPQHPGELGAVFAADSFQFAEAFRWYRHDVMTTSDQRRCRHLFDAVLDHCASVQQKGDMEAITVTGYREVSSAC